MLVFARFLTHAQGYENEVYVDPGKVRYVIDTERDSYNRQRSRLVFEDGVSVLVDGTAAQSSLRLAEAVRLAESQRLTVETVLASERELEARKRAEGFVTPEPDVI